MESPFWNHEKYFHGISLKANFVIGRIPLLNSLLGEQESIKTRTDANKVIEGPVNANVRT